MSFLNALEKVKQLGPEKWVACCPCHDDSTPSLNIKKSGNGYIMHCFGCGANGLDVFGKLGLELNELFGEDIRSDFIPQKVKDEYEEDRFFLAIYNADVKKGIKPTYKENRRRKLAIARMQGIKDRWGSI